MSKFVEPDAVGTAGSVVVKKGDEGHNKDRGEWCRVGLKLQRVGVKAFLEGSRPDLVHTCHDHPRHSEESSCSVQTECSKSKKVKKGARQRSKSQRLSVRCTHGQEG